MFLTGSSGTGKTILLSESLKIKLSKFKVSGENVKVFVTTYLDVHTELLDKYRNYYLVNIEHITFTSLKQLCKNENIVYENNNPQKTINAVLSSLSSRYCDSFVILLLDEVMTRSANFRKTFKITG